MFISVVIRFSGTNQLQSTFVAYLPFLSTRYPKNGKQSQPFLPSLPPPPATGILCSSVSSVCPAKENADNQDIQSFL